MSSLASRITSLTIVYWTVYSRVDQRKHQSSASLAFVWGIHRWPVNSPHKWPVTRKMFPFDDVIMIITALKLGHGWLITSYKNYGMYLLLPYPNPMLLQMIPMLLAKRVLSKYFYIYSENLYRYWISLIYYYLDLCILLVSIFHQYIGVKLVIHSKTATVTPLKFGNG